MPEFHTLNFRGPVDQDYMEDAMAVFPWAKSVSFSERDALDAFATAIDLDFVPIESGESRKKRRRLESVHCTWPGSLSIVSGLCMPPIDSLVIDVRAGAPPPESLPPCAVADLILTEPDADGLLRAISEWQVLRGSQRVAVTVSGTLGAAGADALASLRIVHLSAFGGIRGPLCVEELSRLSHLRGLELTESITPAGRRRHSASDAVALATALPNLRSLVPAAELPSTERELFDVLRALSAHPSLCNIVFAWSEKPSRYTIATACSTAGRGEWRAGGGDYGDPGRLTAAEDKIAASAAHWLVTATDVVASVTRRTSKFARLPSDLTAMILEEAGQPYSQVKAEPGDCGRFFLRLFKAASEMRAAKELPVAEIEG